MTRDLFGRLPDWGTKDEDDVLDDLSTDDEVEVSPAALIRGMRRGEKWRPVAFEHLAPMRSGYCYLRGDTFVVQFANGAEEREGDPLEAAAWAIRTWGATWLCLNPPVREQTAAVRGLSGRDYARKAATLQTIDDCLGWRRGVEAWPEDAEARLAAVEAREAELRAMGKR